MVLVAVVRKIIICLNAMIKIIRNLLLIFKTVDTRSIALHQYLLAQFLFSLLFPSGSFKFEVRQSIARVGFKYLRWGGVIQNFSRGII